MTITDEAESVLFEAELKPHRSLSRRGLAVVLGFLGMVSLGVTTMFWLLGAWPIAGFNGVEVALAILLLRAHARGARAREVLLLSDRGMVVLNFDETGGRSERRLPSAWLNVVVEERHGRVPGLLLVTHGRVVEVARMLGEMEKRDLAGALRDALFRMRNPVFDNPQLQSGI